MTCIYGWSPDGPDIRDRLFAIPARQGLAVPAAVDLRGPNMPPIYQQGRIGSCTAHATAAAFAFDCRLQGLAPTNPSRLFIYFNERAMHRETRFDSGAQLRDGVKILAQLGAPDESLWPYDDTPPAPDGVWPARALPARRPPKSVFTAALRSRAVSYARVPQTVPAIRSALAAGRPVVCGFAAYAAIESREVAATGVLPMPSPGEAPVGGHAVCIVGYDDSTATWIARNSWGEDWGDGGYFTAPYAYFADSRLASDFWVISTVS